MILSLMKMAKQSSTFNYFQKNEETMSRRSESRSVSSSAKSTRSGKSIKEQVINEKWKHVELGALASLRKQHKTQKLEVEVIKLDEELARIKARVKAIID